LTVSLLSSFYQTTSRKTPQVIEQFRREAQATSALNHPNICTIYEIGEHGGRRFIAMEYVKGKTLKQVISRRPLELERMPTMPIEVALPNEEEKRSRPPER